MTNKSVLIIEDEVSLVSALRSKFSKESNIEILVALNGEEGLSVALKKKPDLILLDIEMPKMNGLNMLREIRKDGWGSQVDVVILTNYSDNDKVLEAVNYGANNYLIKSDWKIEDIVSMSLKLLKK